MTDEHVHEEHYLSKKGFVFNIIPYKPTRPLVQKAKLMPYVMDSKGAVFKMEIWGGRLHLMFQYYSFIEKQP